MRHGGRSREQRGLLAGPVVEDPPTQPRTNSRRTTNGDSVKRGARMARTDPSRAAPAARFAEVHAADDAGDEFELRLSASPTYEGELPTSPRHAPLGCPSRAPCRRPCSASGDVVFRLDRRGHRRARLCSRHTDFPLRRRRKHAPWWKCSHRTWSFPRSNAGSSHARSTRMAFCRSSPCRSSWRTGAPMGSILPSMAEHVLEFARARTPPGMRTSAISRFLEDSARFDRELHEFAGRAFWRCSEASRRLRSRRIGSGQVDVV
jgi:hypothetical protein